jgi:hypothetical protein
MQRVGRLSLVLMFAVWLMVATTHPALAHEAPKGSEWIMADWMFLSFGIFAGVSFLAFLLALKSGLLSNLEEAKYHVLTIDEPDYYSPEWARTERAEDHTDAPPLSERG